MIKTLADLNNAGNRLWSRPSHDDTGKRAQDDSLSEEIKAFSLRNDLNEEAYQLIGEARGALAMGQRISARSRLDRAKAAQKDKAKDDRTCPICDGTGKVMNGAYSQTCPRCKGKGYLPDKDSSKDSGIKTLADLNKAGRRFWRGPNLR